MSNRRVFLQQSGIAALAAMLSPSLISSALANPMDKAIVNKVGIQLYTLRDLLQKDVSGVITKLASVGYKQVETFYGYAAGNAANGFWGLDAKGFKALLDANGITSPSGHYNTTAFLEKDGNDETLKKHIDIAATVGQKYLTIPSLPGDHKKLGTIDEYKALAAKFNQAGELCKKQGIKLGYHNHNFEFNDLGGGVTLYDILLKETDPALVSFELDLFWAVNAGLDPIAMFKKNPGRYKMWHVKDMDKADKSIFTEVGTGRIDFKEIFKNAKVAGLENIFVEQDIIKINPYDSITTSYNYIKNVLLK
jgi:sugar phosphate isomerase/epimerase